MKVRKSLILIILLTFSVIFTGPSYAEEADKTNSGAITVDVEKLDEMVKQFNEVDITKDPDQSQNKSDQIDQISNEKSEENPEIPSQMINQAVGDKASEDITEEEKTKLEENPEKNTEDKKDKVDEKDKLVEEPKSKKEEPTTEKPEEKPTVKKEDTNKEEERQEEKIPPVKEIENSDYDNSLGESTGIIVGLESLKSNSDFNNIFSNTKESKGNVQLKTQKHADKRAVPTGNASYADGILSAKSLIIIIAILAAIFSAVSIAIKDRRYKKSKIE